MVRVVNQVTWLFVGVVLVAFAGEVRAGVGDVETTLDSPTKYPAGLASDGTSLFVADWREAKIYQLNRTDGAIARMLDAPTLKPHGLVYAQDKLWVSDDHTGGIFALNLDTGIVETTFQAPDTQAAGLAFADGVLFILTKDKIYKVLPEDGTILGYYDAPEPSCQGMTHDGRYLWISDRIKNELYMVDPKSGKVISILPAPGPYPVGVAAVGDHLWNVDFDTGKLYQLILRDDQMYRLSDIRRARVEYLWSLSNYGPAAVSDLTLNIAVPEVLPNQKLLSEVTFSKLPAAATKDRWNQPCAKFTFGSVPAGTKESLTFHVDAEVSAIRYLLIPERTGSLSDIPQQIRTEYTADGSRYRINTPYIQETVRKIVGDEKNPYWIARKIYDYVIDSLEYEMIGGWDVPEVVLKRGSGSCSEYTYSFIALCRAAGLPARYQGSIVVRGDDASIDEAFHRWAQVYLPSYGWVPVDANRGDKPSPADQARGFGGLSNRFLITTQGGGDSECVNWGYNSFSRYKTTGYAKIDETMLGFWRPLEPDQPSSVDSLKAKDSCGSPVR